MLVIALVLLAVVISTNVSWVLAYLRMIELQSEMAKMLASRTFSEYSIGEARLAETRREQKPAEEGYDTVWSEE